MASVKRQTTTPPSSEQSSGNQNTTTSTDSTNNHGAGAPPPAGSGTTNTQSQRTPIGVGWQPDPSNPSLVMQDANGNNVPFAATAQTPMSLPDSRVAAGDTSQLSTASIQFAKYFTGDDYTIPATLAPETRAELQQTMYDRGLYGATKPKIGYGGWQNEDVSAFNQVLAYANASGTDWQTALKSMPQQAASSAPRQTATVNLSNPEDLKAVYKKAMTDITGGGPVSEQDLDKFVSAYQGMEKTQQQQQIQDQMTAAAGDYTPGELAQQQTDLGTAGKLASSLGSAPSLSDVANPNAPLTSTQTAVETPQQFAQDQIKAKNPGAYGATQIANTYSQFLNAMGALGAKT